MKKAFISMVIFAFLLCPRVFAAEAVSDVKVEIKDNLVYVSGRANDPECKALFIRVENPKETDNPDEKTSYIDMVHVGEDALFQFSYSLENGVDGEYQIHIGGTGIETPQTVRYTFVKKKSTAAEMTSFILCGYPATIRGNSVTLTLPYGMSLESLVPEFEISDFATVYVGGVRQESGKSALSFRKPVSYRIVAEDGSERVYTVNVKNAPGGGQTSGGGGSVSGGGASSYTPLPEQATEQTKPRFTDLESVKWAEEFILELAEKQIISGVGSQRFEPDRFVTREEFVKMLVCAVEAETGEEELPFSDVSFGAWYYPYLSAAYENGLVTGFPDGRFGIGAIIRREDMAVSVAKSLGMNAEEETAGFVDQGAISEYAQTAVLTMKRLGIMIGDENGCFQPHENTTRAQAAKVIALMLKEIGG